jgi:serine/threonine protein kinase
MVGETLDRYKIESKLGEGGMGVVYKARDTHLDRVVAIKVLPHDKVADPERKQRFVQEARAASALNHPGIVTVHDIRSDAGIDFIVMEYAGGRTLDRIIPAKGLGITQALRYASRSPMRSPSTKRHHPSRPEAVERHDQRRGPGQDSRLRPRETSRARRRRGGYENAQQPVTEVGWVVGTAAAMSPEQAEGRKSTALGHFQLRLGALRDGHEPAAVCRRVVAVGPREDSQRRPGAAEQVAASVPPDVERTILRCLRKDPARRYQSMADLKVALEDFAADSAPGTGADCRAASARSRWALVASSLPDRRRLCRQADGAKPGQRPAAPGRSSHVAAGCRALPVVLTRRQPRRDHVVRNRAG